MSLIVEAVYENGVFRPEAEVGYPDRQRVRLDIQALSEGSVRRRGSAESLAQAFAEMDRRGRVDEAAWARFEGERKLADLADLEQTVSEQRRSLDTAGA
jgi:predicted DNA-binding antitoxin AbrB/MazE fold protein